jgi:hypothetical protein
LVMKEVSIVILIAVQIFFSNAKWDSFLIWKEKKKIW